MLTLANYIFARRAAFAGTIQDIIGGIAIAAFVVAVTFAAAIIGG